MERKKETQSTETLQYSMHSVTLYDPQKFSYFYHKFQNILLLQNKKRGGFERY